MNSSSSMMSSRQEIRNLKEKERRMVLKNLLARLLSLLPKSLHFRVSVYETLHQAVMHIKQLEERLENLKTRKQELLLQKAAASSSSSRRGQEVKTQIRQSGPMLEINLVCGFESKIRMHHIIRAVECGGAAVVSAHCCTINDTIIYTIHSQEIMGRIGIDTSTVMERLRESISSVERLIDMGDFEETYFDV